ncbi:transglutaminase family protein [Sphingomonas sp.]|uniref:transglutaminase family protein n=1 Tax=Sphingomonas sp. TaxID=28214 RepID=UPI002B5766F2|nr:transglutaminase family protein [Sphingomonas sp.]HWK35746.1 transglutaminase family protein [Sphingomonas sp.]
MRISIDHKTRYHFSEPQARVVQLLRVTPQDSIDQTVVDWHIGVDCDARLRRARDGFGNIVTTLYAEGPLDGLAIDVQGEVLTAGEAGIVHGAQEPLPPALYRRVTTRTEGSPELLAFAAEATARDAPLLDRLHQLNGLIHQRFDRVAAHHDDGRGAAEVFPGWSASARDLAHILIAAARAAGVPARYVSGYRRDGAHQPAPHAWAEAHVDGLGWIAFDPAHGICADPNYVRVAVALDATGAAPVAGSRLGQGEERLMVDVQVAAMGGDA